MTTLESITRSFYLRIGAGDVEGVIALLAEDVTWTIPGPSAIPYAGTFHGKGGVVEFFRILFDHETLQSFVPSSFIVDEVQGIVCVLGAETAVAIPTGKKFCASWAELFWIRNGLITAFEEHIDTFALAEAYGQT